MSGEILPVLPVRDTILFPGTVAGICAGRPIAVSAIRYANDKTSGKVIVLSQKSQEDSQAHIDNLFDIGVLAEISHSTLLPDDSYKCTLSAHECVKVSDLEVVQDGSDIKREVIVGKQSRFPIGATNEDAEEEISKLMELILQKINSDQSSHRLSEEVIERLRHIKGAEKFAYAVSSNLPLRFTDKQEILEESSLIAKLELVYKFVNENFIAAHINADIKNKVRAKLDKMQRDCYLNEQLRIIQKELGSGKDCDEITVLQKKINTTPFPSAIKKKAMYEFNKLKAAGQFSIEAGALRNYLDWLFKVPWTKFSRTSHNISNAEKVLNRTHYGLTKTKDRILEYLAVHKKSSGMHGAVLCLNGLEGTGKSSIAQSIAKAMNREFVRISLGGIRDEADMRGHRRTYVGSMPGRIIQAICKAKSMNPVILLDEMDKIGHDYRGDPAAALLEILDPEQSKSFYDHYMEVDIDISKVFFIATVNDPSKLMRPLLDRLEIVNIPSYTEEEKLCIARQYIVPKQKTKHGLNTESLSISNGAIAKIIREYTREPGVRSLEREFANICRKIVKQSVEFEEATGEQKKYRIITDNIMTYCGSPKYLVERSSKDRRIGSVNGLAYTTSGGDILTIESSAIPSTRPRIKYTGSLGETMRESIRIAYSYAKSILSLKFGISIQHVNSYEIHVHAPAGATPKDGPSAGIAICTAIISAISGKKISGSIAMTGELSLLGNVLRIGGLREKLLAAVRGGIKVVIVPKANEFDLSEVPPYVLSKLTVMYVEQMQEVVDIMFKDSDDSSNLPESHIGSNSNMIVV